MASDASALHFELAHCLIIGSSCDWLVQKHGERRRLGGRDFRLLKEKM
jgi:hypothetical protein